MSEPNAVEIAPGQERWRMSKSSSAALVKEARAWAQTQVDADAAGWGGAVRVADELATRIQTLEAAIREHIEVHGALGHEGLSNAIDASKEPTPDE